MRALIDGDIIVYRSGFAAEHNDYLLFDCSVSEDPDEWTLVETLSAHRDIKEAVERNELVDYAVEKLHSYEPVENALHSAKHTIEFICDSLGAHDYKIALSTGDQTFRHKLATTAKYKGNRDNMVKPVWYEELRRYLIDVHGATVFTSIEADDALAMAQMEPPLTAICSIDKDLLQVPGMHFNWVTGDNVYMDEIEGNRLLYGQAMSGDSTDNIIGIYRMGPKTAAKIMAPYTTEQEMHERAFSEWAKFISKAQNIAEDEVVIEAGLRYNETFKLVKVGGKYAEEALEEGNEKEKLEAFTSGLT